MEMIVENPLIKSRPSTRNLPAASSAAAGDFIQSRICGENKPATMQLKTHAIAAYMRQSRSATICSKNGRGGSFTASGLSRILRILPIVIFGCFGRGRCGAFCGRSLRRSFGSCRLFFSRGAASGFAHRRTGIVGYSIILVRVPAGIVRIFVRSVVVVVRIAVGSI